MRQSSKRRVRKRFPFFLHIDDLPRQARDKHKEITQKEKRCFADLAIGYATALQQIRAEPEEAAAAAAAVHTAAAAVPTAADSDENSAAVVSRAFPHVCPQPVLANVYRFTLALR